MAINDTGEAVVYCLPCFFPRHLDMHAIALDQRLAQTVRIFVELLERASLRANEAMAEHIFLITSDAHDLFGGRNRNLQTTGGLT